jgi:hypothetical protein
MLLYLHQMWLGQQLQVEMIERQAATGSMQGMGSSLARIA